MHGAAVARTARANGDAWKRWSTASICRRQLKQGLLVLCRIVVYLHVATAANLRSFWSWTHEPVGPQCQQPPLPANHSGLKVLVYGMSKTGTTTTIKTLAKFMKAYHNEDFLIHIWAPLVDEFYSRPENGGFMFPTYRLAVPAYPAYKGHSFNARPEIGADLKVLRETPPEKLAEAIARCRPDGMTFDHLDELFWPIYNVSPGAKVIMLSWRTFEELWRSRSAFGRNVVIGLLGLSCLTTGMHFLPWNAFTIPFWDAMAGRPLSKMMRDGTPLHTLGGPLLLLFKMSVSERRLTQHWFSGFGVSVPYTERLYREYWERARRAIPKDRLLELDFRKHTMADLCRFLEVSNGAECRARKIPNTYKTLFVAERENPWSFAGLVPYFLLIHWVNYRIFYGVLYWMRGALVRWIHRCRCRRKESRAACEAGTGTAKS